MVKLLGIKTDSHANPDLKEPLGLTFFQFHCSILHKEHFIYVASSVILACNSERFSKWELTWRSQWNSEQRFWQTTSRPVNQQTAVLLTRKRGTLSMIGLSFSPDLKVALLRERNSNRKALFTAPALFELLHYFHTSYYSPVTFIRNFA